MYVFKGNGLLMESGKAGVIAHPDRTDWRDWDGVQVAVTEDPAPEGCEYRDFRWLGGEVPAAELARATRALQLWRWDAGSRFCGRCGAENRYDPEENGKHCPGCGHRQYPAQFPVAIVAVTRGDRILLAHNANFPEGLYSVLAGYAELGESIEETVRREVREETGIEIGEPRWFGSQNWAPSSALMLGFQAEWASGDIRVDGKEIVAADWYARDALPANLPMEGSIGRRLIEAFRRA